MKHQCSLTRYIFKLLLEECLKKVKQKYGPDEKIPVRQLYGFGGIGEYNSEGYSLKKLIEKDPKIIKRLGNSPRINTKYLYDKYRDAEKEATPIITLERYHAWVYFSFLGFDGIEQFLNHFRENGTIKKFEFQEQQELIENHNILGKGVGHFGVYHYSRLWDGIYSLLLEIDFDSLVFKEPNRIPTFSVKGTSAMQDQELQPLKYTGTAKHMRGNLIIEIENIQGGGFKKMTFSLQRGPNTIKDTRVFLGAYIGLSRNADIISGTICLIKINRNNDISNIPIEIERYLYLDKWQKRIPLEPLGYNLNNLPLDRDPEDLLQGLKGKFRFCWLASKGERLVESELFIEENYNFYIRTFMSQNGYYSGRIFIQNNIACFNSIGLRSGNKGKKLSASVFLDIKHISRKEEKDFIKGTYNLAGVTSFPKFGFCLVQKVRKSEEIIPTIHEMKSTINQAHENLNSIYVQLQKWRHKELTKS